MDPIQKLSQVESREKRWMDVMFSVESQSHSTRHKSPEIEARVSDRDRDRDRETLKDESDRLKCQSVCPLLSC